MFGGKCCSSDAGENEIRLLFWNKADGNFAAIEQTRKLGQSRAVPLELTLWLLSITLNVQAKSLQFIGVADRIRLRCLTLLPARHSSHAPLRDRRSCHGVKGRLPAFCAGRPSLLLLCGYCCLPRHAMRRGRCIRARLPCCRAAFASNAHVTV